MNLDIHSFIKVSAEVDIHQTICRSGVHYSILSFYMSKSKKGNFVFLHF